MSTRVLCGVLGFTGVLAIASDAPANDRLPARLRPGYRIARFEVQRYMRFILRKVWLEPIRALAFSGGGWDQRRIRADEMVDEIVQLLLPEARRLMGDAIFGTNATHLRIARPELRAQARKAALEGLRTSRERGWAGGLAPMQSAEERALSERLEGALVEDMEDYAQKWVEGAVGLPLRGRGRDRTRALSAKWEKRYQDVARRQVHRYVYWWLRKKQRLSLASLALTKTRADLDRARHEGPVWGLASGASHEAWAQNRVRLDYRWGRLNWQIDRRRLRRRMDQDLAQGTWALARMVKELLAPETMREALQELERRVARALEKPELQQDLERYPQSATRLRQKLQRLKRALDPIFDRAMSRVKLPADMPPELGETTREHGRRFMREELEPNLALAIQRQAATLTARRQVRRRLRDLVSDALARFDPGRPGGEQRRRAAAFVKRETVPRVRDEIALALGAAGLDEFSVGRARHGKTVQRLVERFEVEKLIDRETEKQLSKSSR